jgi:hypothetical protein
MTDSNEWHNPSEDYPPTRPGRLVFFGAAVVCAVGVVIVNWAGGIELRSFPPDQDRFGSLMVF